MLSNNLSKLNSVTSLLLFFFFVLTTLAVDSSKSPKALVTMTTNSGFTKTETFIFETFQKLLKETNLYSETDFQIEYLIDAKSIIIDGENRFLLSVTILQPLPNEIVEMNKKEQSFYLATAKQNIPDTPEGNRIREYVSEEYINQARIVMKNYLNVIDQSEIEKYIQEIINENHSK